MAGIGTGLVGVGIMDTTGSVSGIRYSETNPDKVAVTGNTATVEGGTVTVSDTVLGGNLVITVVPGSGFALSKITVNDTAYTEFTDGESGAKVLTVSGFMMPEANIVVEFTAE